MVWFSNNAVAEKKIYALFTSNLSERDKRELEKLIDLTVENNKTQLALLRENSGTVVTRILF